MMMKTIRVELGDRSYDIVIGNGTAELLDNAVGSRRALMVFDDRTMEL